MNKREFLPEMMALQEYYGKKLSDFVLDIYWKSLQKYSVLSFKQALENIIKNFHPTLTVPFPLVADFIEAMGLTGENRAQAAVHAVKRAAESEGAYRSVDFGDPALHAVINRFGGWPEIARWGANWKFQEKNFMAAYISAVECGEQAGPVAGLHELDNAGKSISGWSEKLISYIGKVSKAPWIGSDFSNKIEHKQDNEPIKMLDDIVKNIGKQI